MQKSSKNSTNVIEPTEFKRKFKTSDMDSSIAPITPNQKRFMKSFHRNTPFLSATGPAGTGKTFLAIYAALKLILDGSSEYDKIIIIRSAVEARSQGFLKGELDDKNAPFEGPYVDNCSKIFPEIPVNDPYSELKNRNLLEFHTTGYLRGLTFERAIVILDEMQNCDYKELKTIITRLGEHSKIILLGDDEQNDLERKKEKSGFGKLQKVLGKLSEDDYNHIEYTFDDVVRLEAVKRFLIADYYYEG